MLVGGPTGAVDRQVQPILFRTLSGAGHEAKLQMAGSPRRHSRVVAGRRCGRPVAMVLLLPCMRIAVASSRWPSALCKHVAEV
jgi:hypothetical protein